MSWLDLRKTAYFAPAGSFGASERLARCRPPIYLNHGKVFTLERKAGPERTPSNKKNLYLDVR